MRDFRFRKTNWLKSAGLAVLLAVLCPAHAAEKTTYFHFDALGSPVAASDQAGNVVWKEEYRPYGARIKQAPAAGSNTRWYTGHPHDDATGLTYAGARYYDPIVGRFMATDPKGFNEANIHSFNRYAYANNNPYKFVDPDGEVGILVLVAAVVVLSVADALVDGIIDGTFGSTPAVGSGEVRQLSTLPGPASGSAVVGKIGFGTLRNALSKSKNVTKSRVDLLKLGKAGTGKGVREVTGDATDARKLFDQLRGNNPVKEVKPGVVVSKGANGGNVTFRTSSKSGPPTVDVHGVQKGVRKIKFLSE